jgi:hypothetical protein
MNVLSRRTLFAVAFSLAAPLAAQNLMAKAAGLPNAPSFAMQEPAAAETTGGVTGVVTDLHGGLVPEASVTLERVGQSSLRETTSNSAGRFVFLNVPAGTYTVLVAAPDLKTYLSAPFTVGAGQHLELATVVLAIATASASVEVSANSTAVAEQELNAETKQRVLAVFPNFYTSFIYDAAPLNTRQKFKLTSRVVVDPIAFVSAAVTAGIETSRDTFPSWGQDGPSYAKRYAAAYGDELLTQAFSYAIYPSIFHQDPRYFYLGPANKTSTRFWHAALAGVITRGDNGRREPNYSHMLGSASAGAVSSVYHPASDSAGYLAALNFGVGIGSKGVQCLIREFVLPHFTTHVPAYAKGRTPAPAPATPADKPAPPQ